MAIVNLHRRVALFFGDAICAGFAEPVFVNLLRSPGSPGTDSQPGGPVRKPYLSYRPARLHRQAISIPRNRFFCSFNVFKYGLRILM